MKSAFRTFCATLLLFGLASGVAAEPVDPATFVTDLVNNLVASGTASGEGEATTEELLGASLDIERIAAGVLGSYRTTLEAGQVERFQGALQTSLAGLIAQALNAFDEYELSIGSVREAKGRAQVMAIMKPDSGGTYEAVFALAAREESWVTQNLTLNGVNLGLTYRNQFAALMQENNDDFDATLEAWARDLQSAVADVQ